MSETLVLSYEPHNRAFWHADCENHFGGVMSEVRREEGRSLMMCLYCGAEGYYPVGAVGRLTVPRVEAQPER
jgi:hypothetical protein